MLIEFIREHQRASVPIIEVYGKRKTKGFKYIKKIIVHSIFSVYIINIISLKNNKKFSKFVKIYK